MLMHANSRPMTGYACTSDNEEYGKLVLTQNRLTESLGSPQKLFQKDLMEVDFTHKLLQGEVGAIGMQLLQFSGKTAAVAEEQARCAPRPGLVIGRAA